MKQILTSKDLIEGSGCYLQEVINPMTKMPYFKDKKITPKAFLKEKKMPPQDRLWFLINSCELDNKDKEKLIDVFNRLHSNYFNTTKRRFDDYVRTFNRLFYKEKKLTKVQVEKIIITYLK